MGKEKAWQKKLDECIRSVADITQRFRFTEDELKSLLDIEKRYPICIPEYYLDLIDPDDNKDSLRKMCIPDAMEFSPGGSKDTSGEGDNTVVQGMQHKYPQTALILSTNQCAMYCRHCFRKRLVGYSSQEIAKRLPEMAAYVKSHPEISNVLISGGDAFVNSNEVIEKYLETFTSISSISFIRFGTRTPVSFPFRITEDDGDLTALLAEYSKKKQIFIVTQFNHPREITAEAVKAVKMLSGAGCVVFNQTVLLKGVNDNPSALASLMNGLVEAGVIPYYVFQCRPVEGVKNQFQVPIVQGFEIVDKAKAMMAGPAKSFRYAMSHPTGKIEILGKMGENMLFKHHQARNAEDNARIFTRPIDENECWF